MKVILVDNEGKEIFEPYNIRFQNWTEERYYKESPRDRKCEYVRGELIMVAAMSNEHSKMVMFLSYLLKGYCDAKGLGEVLPGVTIRLMPEVNREPDICFIPQKSVSESSKIPLKLVPPFILEVSHTTQKIDLGEKVEDYESAGVEEYWVVDIDQEEMVTYILEDGKYKKESRKEEQVKSKVIPGFYIEGTWLWEHPMPSAFECLKKILNDV